MMCCRKMSVICKNCKYFKPNPSFSSGSMKVTYGLCSHPRSQTIDNVSGEIKYKNARDMRRDPLYINPSTSAEVCGVLGQYYKAETPHNLAIRKIQQSYVVELLVCFCCSILFVLCIALVVHYIN